MDALAMLQQPDGPVFCALGRFASAGGTPMPRAARWNGTSWSPLGAGLVANPSGGADALEVLDVGNGPELFSGGALYPGSTVHRWNGTAWDPLGNLTLRVADFAVFDDGAGPALYAGLYAETSSAQILQRWNGTSWGTFPGGGLTGNWRVNELAVYDDGSGPALHVGGSFQEIGTPPMSAPQIARWNGTSWSAVGAPNEFAGWLSALFVHDDGMGGGAQLYAGGTFFGAVKRWNGTSWSLVGAGMANFARVDDFEVFDDGTGPALYATGQLNPLNGGPPGISRWNGVTWSNVGTGLRTFGYTLAVYDDGQGEGPALFAGGDIDRAGDFAAGSLARWKGCRVATFCTGDGLDPAVTTPCPCGNIGAPGRGCAWGTSFPGALLELSGRIDPDTLVLRGSAMPSATTAIYLKGDAVASAGIVFGDGVRCVDGNLIWMTIVQNQGGASQYPGPGQLSLSVRGGTPPGSGLTAWYQTYFRSASPTFCPPATFNVTNGIRVAW